ncbi:MAG: PAS domain S-box protein [Vicinamibacteria bacterium]|nr:PAS domain S-box protein [Vicinamibacteria bacterium]
MLALALAVAGLLGWITPWSALARGVPGGVRMAPATALAFVALAGTLLFGRGSRERRVAMIAAGAFTVAAAVDALTAYARGVTSVLDGLLVPDLVGAPPVSDGRMAPLTAVGFLLAGLSTLLFGLGPQRRLAGHVAGALGAVVATLGALVSLSFVHSALPFGGPDAMPVAATTALAFVALGLALVSTDGAERFPMNRLSGSTHAARLARTFLPLVPMVGVAHAAFHFAVPAFENALRDALLSLLLLAVVLLGVLWAASQAGRFLEAADAERRRAVASERRFGALLQHSPLSIVITRLDGRIVTANQRAATFFGYPVADVIGRNVLELDLWPAPALRGQLLGRLAAGEVLEGAEFRFRHADGTLRDALVSGAAIEVDGEEPLILAAFLDVTERRQLEARLLRAQNLETVGRLAGGIAHDFNNLLGIALGHAERLRRHADPEVARRAAGIAEAGERAARLTRQLLAFSRRQVMAPEPLDLNALVADVESLLRSLVGEQVQVEIRRSAGPAAVLADPGQLQQVLLELCSNARDAMPDGGRLVVEVVALAAAGPEWPQGIAGPQVLLRVEDDGRGIDAHALAHAFEPFYSTKDGAGLGLATVYGIVQQSGGRVRIDGAPGRGTRVEILLPQVAAAVAPAPAPRGDAVSPAATTTTILLAEDESALRELTEEVLTEAGYHVLSAEDVPRALEVAAAHEGPIDLLLSDVVMPGGDGAQLAARLRESRPAVRVLFVSGYPEEVISQQGRLDPGVALLSKPFTSADLLQRVASALAPRPGRA